MEIVLGKLKLDTNRGILKKIKVYLWIVSFVRKYRMSFFLLLVTGFIQTAVVLIIPKFIQYVIDVLIPNRDLKQFYLLFSYLIPLVVLMLVSMAVSNIVLRIVQEKSSNDLQLLLFQHLRKLGFSYYERNPVGETLSLFQAEIPAIQNIYRQYLPLLIDRILMLVISLCLLLAINAKLTLLIIPFFLSYYLIGPHFEKKQAGYARKDSKSRSEYNKKIYDSLSALLELRIHGMEKWDLSRLVHAYETFRKNRVYAFLYALLRGTVRKLTINLGAVALLIFGAYSVKNGTMQAGAFIAFFLYYFHVMGELTRIVTIMTEQNLLLVQGEKLYDLIQTMPDVADNEKAPLMSGIQGKLSFEHVNFGYHAGPNIVQNLSLEIAAGQRVAFVGSSGGGKSTILKLVGRFYDPHMGTIRLDNVPLYEWRLEQLRSAMGYVFQETYLFGMSIKENIRFGNPDASDEAIIHAAQAANADRFIRELPNGYETNVGERGIKLSGGQKQRIAIARMILKNPAVILLDEATSSLDNINEQEVQMALDRLLEGKTTIAIAHRLSTVRHFDLIVVIEDGAVVEKGSYKELIERNGFFTRLVQGEVAEIG